MNRLHVYIIEAHPMDEWGAPVNGVPYNQPKSLEERRAMANTFATALEIKDNMVVDDMMNPCDTAYEARSQRLYVVDGGKIVWRTGLAPFQYDVEGLQDFLASRTGNT